MKKFLIELLVVLCICTFAIFSVFNRILFDVPGDLKLIWSFVVILIILAMWGLYSFVAKVMLGMRKRKKSLFAQENHRVNSDDGIEWDYQP